MAKVKSITFAGYEDVYNMEVSTYHNYISNGLVLHNCDAMRYFFGDRPTATTLEPEGEEDIEEEDSDYESDTFFN